MGLDFLSQEILSKMSSAEDLPKYINRSQLALACDVTEGTARNWTHTPKPDLKIGSKYYWLPKTVADFIKQYRIKNNK